MRIGIDVHTVTDLMQGTRTYTLNLVRHLLAADAVDEFTLYVTGDPRRVAGVPAGRNVRVRRVRPANRLLRIPFAFPVRLARDGIDVFHCQYMGPPIAATPYVVAIHDIIHEYMPELYPKALCRMMRLAYPLSARRASRVLTISENSKRDIVRYYGIPEERVIVTPCAADERFRPVADAAALGEVQRRHGIPAAYILFVGRLEPRKNLLRLVEAYARLRRGGQVAHALVIAGMEYYRHEQLYRRVAELDVAGDVFFTGGVPDDDLPALYSGAALFVYPTLAEGFGLPPLEAMACGTPVVTSNCSALPEVCGDAALLVDPTRTEEIAAAIAAVLGDGARRATMRERGLARARQFSWAAAAAKTLEVFRAVHGERGGRPA
jgi:glycosyltransferase involved in cell wall biosynthesis